MHIQTTKVFKQVSQAYEKGFAICSAQGSSRSGKTYNIIIFLLYLCLSQRISVSVCRKTLPSLKRSVLRDFKSLLAKTNINVEVNLSDLVFTFPNGSFIEFFSTDNEEKLRGSKRQVLFINEANELSEIEFVQLNMRTTLFSILDYNPSFSDEHWINKVNSRTDCFHFITTYKDNVFLEPKVIQEIEALKFSNPTLWRIYGEGLQAQAEGLVYPKYNLIDSFPEYAKKVCVASDYGFSNDPTAIILCGVYENKLFVHEIEYATHLLTNDIIQALRPYKQYTLISEIDDRLIAELRLAGFVVEKVKKSEVMVGVQKIQQMEINITRSSINVIKEIKNYTFLCKDGKYLNRPIDKFNHALDALRYYVLMRLFNHKNVLGSKISLNLQHGRIT